MKDDQSTLKCEIIEALKSQGFLINPHLKTETADKDVKRRVHVQKRKEIIQLHRKFLLKNLEKTERYSVSGGEIDPSKIDLELVEVKPNSIESTLFFWWNLIWWSLPYARAIGRQMRFVIRDKYNGALFGLICLQSPPLRSSTRDDFLGLNDKNVDYWINQSMYAQRVGALPPYNDLLGAKMVALSLTSNEIREAYERKYENKETLLKKRILPSRLLFITTTSAYGKSSIYERITYKGEIVGQFIGFTAGSGTFHIPQTLYEKMLSFLKKEGFDVKRGYGTGPSRKLKLINLALRKLNMKTFSFHNIKRGYYIFSNVVNLQEVIQKNEAPQWYDRPFERLSNFWKRRWCIPRSHRIGSWKQFDSNVFFDNVKDQLESLGTRDK